jgi:hypothetical protein
MPSRTLSRQDPIVSVFCPCDQGTRLLENFAAARPENYGFLEPKDFIDLGNSAFAGIAEWDAFADDVQRCATCGEV